MGMFHSVIVGLKCDRLAKGLWRGEGFACYTAHQSAQICLASISQILRHSLQYGG